MLGILDGGLRLWVVGRSVLARILVPLGLAAAASSFVFGDFTSSADIAFYGRAALLVGLLLVGTAAGAAVFRLRLDEHEIDVAAVLRLLARHWFAVTLSLVLGLTTVSLTLIVLGGTTADTLVLALVLVPFSVLFAHAISLSLVAAILWSGEDGWIRRLMHIPAGKLFGLAALWTAAIVIFSVLVVAWQIILLGFFLESALAPLGVDLDEWQSAGRGFILLIPAAVLLGPGSGGVWTLALLDESVRRTGLDLQRQARAIEAS
ncbi:MAG: hypothetical protein ACC652_04790 [Acidimicrobiales bacterium]